MKLTLALLMGCVAASLSWPLAVGLEGPILILTIGLSLPWLDPCPAGMTQAQRTANAVLHLLPAAVIAAGAEALGTRIYGTTVPAWQYTANPLQVLLAYQSMLTLAVSSLVIVGLFQAKIPDLEWALARGTWPPPELLYTRFIANQRFAELLAWSGALFLLSYIPLVGIAGCAWVIQRTRRQGQIALAECEAPACA